MTAVEGFDDIIDVVSEGFEQAEALGSAALNAARRFVSDPLEAIGDSLNDRPWQDEAPREAQLGDIIAISRGAYFHYAIYVSDAEVIHYTSLTSDIGDNRIMVTDFSHFLRGQEAFFVLDFGSRQDRQNKALEALWTPERIYSPQESVQRARDHVNEANYDLFGDNCEHFSMWCKTGEKRSSQVIRLLSLFFVPGQYRLQPGVDARRRNGDDASTEARQAAIQILNRVPGMTRAHRRDFPESRIIFRLTDGTSVRAWKNPLHVLHVFLADSKGNCAYGGFVGVLDTRGLEAALDEIGRTLT